MLSKDDLDFMRSSQKEIRLNREREIDLIFKEVVSVHPVTKEEITEDVIIPVEAIITVVTSSTTLVGSTKKLADGVEIISGDVIVDIDIDKFPEDRNYEKVNAFNYEGVKYIVKSFGRLGISYPSRIELVGRRAF